MYFLKHYYILYKKSLWFQRYCLRIPWLFLLNAKNQRYQNSEKTIVKVKHSLIRGAAAVSLAGVDVVRNMGDPLEWVIRFSLWHGEGYLQSRHCLIEILRFFSTLRVTLELWTLNDTAISGFFCMKSTSSDQGGGDPGSGIPCSSMVSNNSLLTWWSRTKCLAAQLLAGWECTVQRWKGSGETDEGNWNASGKQKCSGLEKMKRDLLTHRLSPWILWVKSSTPL